MARSPATALNPQQHAFLEAMLSNGGDATAAYRTVYGEGKTERSTWNAAHRLRKNPLIAARLREAAQHAARAVDVAVERYGITADHIADAIARLAFTDLRQVATWKTETVDGKRVASVQVIDSERIDPDAHQAISEVKIDDKGRITVKLYNKGEALMNLARLKGWVADKPVDAQQLVMLKIER